MYSIYQGRYKLTADGDALGDAVGLVGEALGLDVGSVFGDTLGPWLGDEDGVWREDKKERKKEGIHK